MVDNKFKDLVIKSGTYSATDGTRGVWDLKGIKDFLRILHKPASHDIVLKKFFGMFHRGGEIVHMGHYCRMNILKAIKELDLEGNCSQYKTDEGQFLKIGFAK